jgi:phosphatidate cytidylyltransferase
MTKELQKRLFTSFILIFVLVVCLFLNKFSWLILVIAASIIIFLEFNNLVNKIWKRKEFSKHFIKIICFFYLLLFIYSAYFIYEIGLLGIIIILSICIFSDIGGYVVGKTIGGKKLIKISPNKTISGAIGSFLFSLIPIGFFFIIYNYTNNNLFNLSEPLIEIIFFSLAISLICQLGDLLISYFKRKAKVKDTGTILPGHGGVLDRIDGIIFGIPFGLLLLILFF